MPNSAPFQDPIQWFGRWFEQAAQQIKQNHNAVAVATVDERGRPSLRMVLLKDFGPQGFVFHTNYRSRKARQIDQHPHVAMDIYWRGIERQVRVEGRAERLSAAASDAYFATRARPSQVGAWASLQSQPLKDRQDLLERIAHFEEKFADGPVPRPENWGGYLVVPERIEFWEEQAHRLHTRWVFEREDPDQPWQIGQLYP